MEPRSRLPDQAVSAAQRAQPADRRRERGRRPALDRPLVLEDDPDSGYCYTTIYEAGDAVLLAYCAGNVQRDVACLNRLRIRRLPLRALDGLPGMAMYGIG